MAVSVDGRAAKRMGKKAAKKVIATPEEGTIAAAYENPLVPNAVLQEMYRKMVEMRLLGEHIDRLARKAKLGWKLRSTAGQEACRISVTQGLGTGDLVMESQPGGLMNLALGVPLPEVIRGFNPPVKGAAKETKKSARAHQSVATRLLPFLSDGDARLFAGLGTSLLMKRLEHAEVLVIYVERQEVSRGVWRRVLQTAASEHLPVIFVVLPRTGRSAGNAKVIEIAHDCGVPGIAVDASDAVALFRVTQESLWRIRTGGGPVLIEGIPFSAPGKPKQASDPIQMLQGYLLHRHICTEEWMAGIETGFLKRLKGRTQAA